MGTEPRQQTLLKNQPQRVQRAPASLLRLAHPGQVFKKMVGLKAGQCRVPRIGLTENLGKRICIQLVHYQQFRQMQESRLQRAVPILGDPYLRNIRQVGRWSLLQRNNIGEPLLGHQSMNQSVGCGASTRTGRPGEKYHLTGLSQLS